MPRLRRLDASDRAFPRRFARLCARGDPADDPALTESVAGIVAEVRRRGDAAVRAFTARFDGWTPHTGRDLEIPRDQLEAATREVPRDVLRALKLAHRRITEFHRLQRERDVGLKDDRGDRVEQIVRPLDRVGLYVPGGTARYPSSVLMTAVPARVAGVREIIMVSPTPGGEPDPALLAAAQVSGVDRVFRIGGAQAVAALAYGTKTVPRVDKIVGPGNAYVAAAKRLVRGACDVDMEAGPSEVLVVADDSARADFVAADLLAQAEHDPRAVPVLVTSHAPLLDAVEAALGEQLATLPRRAIAESALKQGAAILVPDLDTALEVANAFAAEHLELMVRRPRQALAQVKAAGAVFLGAHTPEPVGDYVAGPSHVLPTAGTARFASPLGVHHFLRRTSVLEFSPAGLEAVAPAVMRLAEVEGLHAHARAVALRQAARKRPGRGKAGPAGGKGGGGA